MYLDDRCIAAKGATHVLIGHDREGVVSRGALADVVPR